MSNGDDPAHLTFPSMAYNYQCIIRQQGTTGPEGIWDSFFFNDLDEGQATYRRKIRSLPGGQILTLSGPVPHEAQIFTLNA